MLGSRLERHGQEGRTRSIDVQLFDFPIRFKPLPYICLCCRCSDLYRHACVLGGSHSFLA